MNKETLIKYFKRFEEEKFLLKLYDAQPASAKIGFYAAIVIALLTHIIMYSNLIIEHHLPGFASDFDKSHAGRWFHHNINRLNFYYMNWVTGLMQVAFLAIFVFIIIKAFNIKNRLYALLIAGIMVTFPTLAEFNQFFDDAAPYTFAALLCIAAFYITMRYKFGWLAGIFLIMLGLALYQAMINVAIIVILIHLIIYVLKEKPQFLELVKYVARFLLLIFGGLVAYYISWLVLQISPQYQGMGDLSLMGIYNDVLRAYQEVFLYFFSNEFRIGNRFITLAYGFIIIAGLVLLVLAIIKNRPKNGGYLVNIIVVSVFILLLPLGANFTRIPDESGLHVLKTVSYAFAFFLIIPLLLLDNFKLFTFGVKNIIPIALVFIIGFNIALSNFIYLRGQVITMHAMNTANRMAARMEPLLPQSSHNQIFINGSLQNNPIYPSLVLFPEYIPRTVNCINFGNHDHFMTGWPWSHSERIIRYRVGLNVYPLCPFTQLDRKQYILDEAISMGMPVYPQEGSVALIDGVVVAMLNFLGRVDIEETSQNNFTATISHLGKSTDLVFEYTWFIYRDGQVVEEINSGHSDLDRVSYEINQPGSYQFKVIVTNPYGTEIINEMSQVITVESFS